MPFVKENIFNGRTVYDKQSKLSETFTAALHLRRLCIYAMSPLYTFAKTILLPKLIPEEFMRRTAAKGRGRKPQEYAHISRISDEVF